VNIVTFVKHVPASAVMPKISASGIRIEEDGLSYEVNETDLYALEEALYQRSLHNGSVTAVTVGPVRAKDGLYVAYAKGVDHAIHVIDEAFRGTNPSFNVRAGAEVLKQLQPDIAFAGIQADDDLQGQFGVALAEAVSLPVITAVSEVRIDPTKRIVTVIRELGAGFKEELEADLPCLLTIQFGIRPVRYTSVMSIVKARSRKIESLSGDAQPFALQERPASSHLRVVELSYPSNSGNCELITGSAEESARKLVGILVDRGVV
jgi:electron transfer flavoprotein beta subunit